MARPDRLIKSMIRTRYLITLSNEETFDGILVDADPQHLVFADVDQVAPNGDRLPVQGQLWIPRPNVKYMQQPKP